MLDKHQIQDYYKNGFIVIEELLNKDEIKKTRGIIDQFIEESREINESDNIFDLEDDHSKDNPRLTRVKQPHLINIHFLNLIKNSLITKVLKDLLGDNILLKSSKLNTKFEKGGSAVEWHQDWAFYPHTNDDVLAVGVMLDDVNLSNGPLKIIPKGHKSTEIDLKTIALEKYKDLNQIAGLHYNPTLKEFYGITKKQADYNFYYQCLVGDSTENYKGAPTYGDVKTKKTLTRKKNLWKVVKDCFKEQGLTEDDALTQARLARILRNTDYDFKKKQPILWSGNDK